VSEKPGALQVNVPKVSPPKTLNRDGYMSNLESDHIRNAVQEYLLGEFLPGEDPAMLTNSTPLITGGILDSISTVKLVSFLEERFHVRFEAHEVSVDYLDTIDQIVETIKQKA
jgi:acyl carrier protein